MRTGRPAKPTALHELHGTDRAYVRAARRSEPKPEGDLSKPPPWLNRSQRDGWRYAIAHAPAHLLKKLDRGMLAAWVVAEDNLRLAVVTQNRLNSERPQLPFMIRSPIGMSISPYFEIIDRATKAMFRAADHLGFSPVSRPRIRLDDDPARESPWAQFRVMPGGRQ